MTIKLPIDDFLGQDPDQKDQKRLCEHEGCFLEGLYRAPKDRSAQPQYYWFCLDHVRAYNLSWNYYQDMTPEEAEAHRIHAARWERPTWPLGHIFSMHQLDQSQDPFGVLTHRFKRRLREEKSHGVSLSPHSPEAKALKTLDLKWPLSFSALKKRYYTLVKHYHPDRQNAPLHGEERLKEINQAYGVLKKFLETVNRS
jgi:hypothetical protein